jgi:hypothetical protein
MAPRAGSVVPHGPAQQRPQPLSAEVAGPELVPGLRVGARHPLSITREMGCLLA